MSAPAAVVLAAGAARRFRAAGGTAPTKLVVPFRGVALVRHPVMAALAAGCHPVIVVTGHAAAAVAAALDGLAVRLAHNARFAEGLAGSLRTGLEALPAAADAVLVLLGDMPLVDGALLRTLLRAAGADPGAQAVVPTAGGVRGNPVLLRRALFPAVAALKGDEGARRLLRDPSLRVAEVPVAGPAARLDVDEPGALEP